MRTAKSEPISPRLTGASGEMLSQISNRMVQLHKRYYGKGPTKARSYVMGDLVVCLMRGGFTRAEETLMGSGRAGLVHEQRSEFQEALKHEFTSAISEITGREVVAFMSNTHNDPPLIVEIFLLAPGADLETGGLEAQANGYSRDGSGATDGAGPTDGAGHTDGAGPTG